MDAISSNVCRREHTFKSDVRMTHYFALEHEFLKRTNLSCLLAPLQVITGNTKMNFFGAVFYIFQVTK